MKIIFPLYCASFAVFACGKAVSTSSHKSSVTSSTNVAIVKSTLVDSVPTVSISAVLPANTDPPALMNGNFDSPDLSVGPPTGWTKLNPSAFVQFTMNNAQSPPTCFVLMAQSQIYIKGPVEYRVGGVYHAVTLKAGTTYAISYYLENSGWATGNVTLSMTRSGNVIQHFTYSSVGYFSTPAYVLQGPFLYTPDAALADANGDVTEVLQVAVTYPAPVNSMWTRLYFDTFSVEPVP